MASTETATPTINAERLARIEQHSLEVRSLSPAYWYVCDATRAKRLKCRAMVAGPFASKVAAQVAIAARSL